MNQQDKLKAICMHLPYGVKCIITDKIHKGWMPAGSIITFDWDKRFMLQEGKIKLLLTPLSEINKEIEVNGLIIKNPIHYLYFQVVATDNDMYGTVDEFEDYIYENLLNPTHLPSLIINKLLEWGYDVDNLIGKGYALDKTKLK